MTDYGDCKFVLGALLLAGCICTVACGDGSTDPGGEMVGPAGPSGLPCDVEAVLKAKCQRCHGAEPENGAPFSLMTYEDTQLEYPRKGSDRVYLRIKQQVDDGTMPFMDDSISPPVEPLNAEQKGTLREWVEAGGQSASTDCR